MAYFYAALMDQFCAALDNLDSGVRERFHAELITWETHTRPSVGEYSQAVINKQFPKDIDIFVGMMGTYFGTATPNWGSGTEEEFRIAFESRQVNGSPDIMFYFSNAVSSLRDVDPEQLAKVAAFRKELGELGVYYWQYDDQAGLMLDLHRQLTQTIIQIAQEKDASGEVGTAPDQSAVLLPNYTKLLADTPIVSIEVLGWQAAKHLQKHTAAMNDISSEVVKLSKEMNAVMRAVNRANQNGKAKELEKARDRLSEALRRYRLHLFALIPTMRSEFEASMLLIQRVLLIRRDSDLVEEVPDENIFVTARGMRESVLKMKEQLANMSETFAHEIAMVPAFATQGKIILALHADIEAYADSVDKLIKKFCEDFE
ncbi:hypothetical protein [Celeribacter sp.]|uniref:hypothetical protein n=1 Tax=Celeribacter sp. TaxID=1890673 RepID=UPI003A8DE010